ncbi:MAG TPA: ATP-binding cassette domain-containing protein [Acidimicrobiales bacterium]|nr:ATP-binding cassette domain-containing protein [Acidimicrobiales bacterium]
MTPIVEARALSKRFGKVAALDGLDLVVEPGQVVALLGPNGAGKTTFVRLVGTLLHPDSGTLRVGGHDVVTEARKVRRLIGLAGQYAAVEGAMTGRENLEMVARLYGQRRADARANATSALERLGLTDAGSRLVRTYSGGMRRRLDLGASLVGAPRLLLLDEPTTGLDPGSRLELWDTIRALVERGTDVLLTTQYLDEADQLAHRVVIIDHGSVIADGTPNELKAKAGRDVVEVQLVDAALLDVAADTLRALGGDEPVIDRSTRRVSVSVAGGTEPLMAAARSLQERGLPVDNLALRRPTLDEVFLTLTSSGAAA